MEPPLGQMKLLSVETFGTADMDLASAAQNSKEDLYSSRRCAGLP